MVPIIDTTKTVGLIKLPGAMTGMILAGASPIDAVQMQIIIIYMLLGGTAITALAAAAAHLPRLLHAPAPAPGPGASPKNNPDVNIPDLHSAAGLPIIRARHVCLQRNQCRRRTCFL